jgi:periplasmic protein CpxP/Spy
MKKLIFACSMMLTLSAASFAQATAPATPATSATPAVPAKGKMSEKGKENSQKGKEKGEKGNAPKGMGMGLTPDQETKFKAFNESHKEAVKKVQMDKALSADAKKTQIDALKGTYETNVKGVLNADQYTKWLAKRNDKGGDHQGKMDEHKGKKEDHKDKMGDHKDMKGEKKGNRKADKAEPQGAGKSN